MNSIYVLLILSHVYVGYAPHSQEFYSLESCQIAQKFFKDKEGLFTGDIYAECVKK